MDSLFQRSLEDLIKTLRASHASSTIISRSVDDIRRELRSGDAATRSVALQKLTYLSSLHGVDPTFAAFSSVDLLSSPFKSNAYLAASLSLPPTSDLLLLLPNQLRKDLSSPSPSAASSALSFLSSTSSPSLASELCTDLPPLLSSSRPSVRRRAVPVALRFFSLHPDSVRLSLKRLVDILDDPTSPAAPVALSAFTQLTSLDPLAYLPLAPDFFRFLDSKNNWILIKTLKIFAKLAPLEPRLAKRILDPVCDLLRRSSAKSLLLECIKTVASSLNNYPPAVKLAVQKVQEFLAEDDPNLRYVALNSLSILSSTQLWAVHDNKEAVFKSLSDPDPYIRLQALRLVMIMVSEDNVCEITRILMNFTIKSDPEFSNEILGEILSTCSRNLYELILDFDWYVSVLGEMVRNPHCRVGVEIERQLVDIGLRVRDARPELVSVGRSLLIDPALLGNPVLHCVLSAAAWVSGEYVEFSRSPLELMEALFQPRTNLLPPVVRAVYLQSAFKVLVFSLHSYHAKSDPVVDVDSLPVVSGSVSEVESAMASNSIGCDVSVSSAQEELSKMNISSGVVGDDIVQNEDNVITHTVREDACFTSESIAYMLNLIKMSADLLSGIDDVEVQERVRNVLGLIHVLEETPDSLTKKDDGLEVEDSKASEILRALIDAFSEELGPVSLNAQERVPVPDGLCLDENLADLDAILGSEVPASHRFLILGNQHSVDVSIAPHLNLKDKEESELSTESTSLLAEHRKRHGLYYLPTARNGAESNDYPPANDDLQLLDSLSSAAGDLWKLSEPSKKPIRAKPRPVVVKLDDGDEGSSKTANLLKDSKDDLVSGVVRDILLGDGSKYVSSWTNASDKSSQRREKEVSLNGDSSATKLKESSVDAEKLMHRSPSSRKSRHHNHGKEISKDPQDEIEKGEMKQKSSRKKTHHDRRHKTRHRADEALNVVPQAPVIQDFLL